MSSQREAYQIPSGQQSPSAGMAMRSVVNTSSAANDEGLPMRYICGDCGTTFPLKRADTIRCVECGCRVLYKERTKRYVSPSPLCAFTSGTRRSFRAQPAAGQV